MTQKIDHRDGIDTVLFRKSLLVKLLSIVIVTTTLGFLLLIFKAIKKENQNLFAAEVRASQYMAQPILNSLYKDMMEERADMARHLITGTKTIEGVKRVKIIRQNGLGEAFQDMDTLKEVEETYGELKPEWTLDHPKKTENVATGVDNKHFQEALLLFKEGRKEAVYYIENSGSERLLTFLLPVLKKPKCNSCHEQDESIRGVLMISTSLEHMYVDLATSRKNWILLGSMTLFGTCFALALMARSVITRPIFQTTDILMEIAEGKGDLTKRLVITSVDEVGIMRKVFNKFIAGMQEMIRDIRRSSSTVAVLSNDISKASEGFHKAANSQMAAIEDTSTSIIEMDKSTGNVKSNTDELLISVRGAFDSSHEMSTAITDIARNTEVLETAVNQTSNAINEIVSFQNKIATHIGTLYTEIEQVVSTTNVFNTVIREVGSLSKDQATLAERVEQIVVTHMVAVNKSTETIDKMIADVTKTSSIMNDLEERSRTIGNIVYVISDIADTSRLLSLNAAILAAQTGNDGKGFHILASEMKSLSEKTRSSTKEVAELIEQVQKDIAATAASVGQSIATVVSETVRLSKDTGSAVNNIKDSSAATLDMARKVEKASQELTKAVNLVTGAVNKINEMVSEIKHAIESQTGASDNILKATDDMQTITLNVKRSITAQSHEGQLIHSVIRNVSEKMKANIHSIMEHKSISEKAVTAIEVIRFNSAENALRAKDLDQMVDSLLKQAALLKEKVESFKV